MAKSTCIKCGNHLFEMATAQPKDGPVMWFVQCSSCGGVIGTHEFASINNDLKLIKGKLGIV